MKDVLLYPLQNLNEYKEILSYIKESDGAALINGLLPMQKPHIAYSLFKELKKHLNLGTFIINYCLSFVVFSFFAIFNFLIIFICFLIK